MRRAATLLLMGAVVPGSAQLTAGPRRVGRVAVRIWATLLGSAVLLGLLWLTARSLVFWLLTVPLLMPAVAVACFGWALFSSGLLVHAWLLGHPRTLPRRARQGMVALTAVLLLVTSYPPIAVGRRAWAAAGLIGSVFTGRIASAATAGRYNVLLLGGDAGPDRIGTRPDSVTLASIDAVSGRTVLFSLPRNLENVPFAPRSPAARAWPQGYSCGDDCLLNAIYSWGAKNSALFPQATDPGAEAMKEAAEGITGLKVNYYVLIDLSGFEDLIDAMGGITVTVRAPVPIGGGTSRVSGYVQPGTRRLDGYHALWFARSRHGASDYDRMARQRCVMDAMLHQLDPQVVLENFQRIAAAGRQVVSTDVPAGTLPTLLDLALKAKSQPVRSVQFVPPLITPARPDFGLIRSTVRQVLAPSGAPEATATGTAGGPAGPAMSGPGASGPAASAPAASGPGAGGARPDAPASTASGPTGSSPTATGSSPTAAVDVRAVCAPT